MREEEDAGHFFNHFVYEKIINKFFFCLNQTQGARGEDRGQRPWEEDDGMKGVDEDPAE